jgi:hypothetical protein
MKVENNIVYLKFRTEIEKNILDEKKLEKNREGNKDAFLCRLS